MANGETMSEPNKEQWNHAKALWGAACGGMPEGINEARIRAMAEAIAARDAAQLDAITAELDTARAASAAMHADYRRQIEALTAERDELRAEVARVKCALAEVADCHVCAGPVGDHPYAECLECSRKAMADDERRAEELLTLRAELSLCHDRLESLRRILDERGLHADERLRRLRSELEKA
jgi:hypothetical protein